MAKCAQWRPPEQPHPLPHPTELRSAVPTNRVLSYLDEFKLADWDVLTYYAKAATSGESSSYASDVRYFLEVRPFQAKDILKMPGGEGGKSYQLIEELSGIWIESVLSSISSAKRTATGRHPHAIPRMAANWRPPRLDLADASRHVHTPRISSGVGEPAHRRSVLASHLAQAETWLKAVRVAAYNWTNWPRRRIAGADGIDRIGGHSEAVSEISSTTTRTPSRRRRKVRTRQLRETNARKLQADRGISRNEAQAAQDLVQSTFQSEQSLRATPREVAAGRPDQVQADKQEELLKKLYPRNFSSNIPSRSRASPERTGAGGNK